MSKGEGGTQGKDEQHCYVVDILFSRNVQISVRTAKQTIKQGVVNHDNFEL